MLTAIAWIIGLFLLGTVGVAIVQGLPLLIASIFRGFVSIFWPYSETAGQRRARIIADRRKSGSAVHVTPAHTHQPPQDQ